MCSVMCSELVAIGLLSQLFQAQTFIFQSSILASLSLASTPRTTKPIIMSRSSQMYIIKLYIDPILIPDSPRIKLRRTLLVSPKMNSIHLMISSVTAERKQIRPDAKTH
jgi:hypothetical protein